MSLARSLLALAALLAAAAADSCTIHTFGLSTGNTVPLPEVRVPAPGGDIVVPINACSDYGFPAPAVGERVTACVPGSGPAPDVREKYNTLSPLTVVAVDAPYITVDIILYCA